MYKILYLPTAEEVLFRFNHSKKDLEDMIIEDSIIFFRCLDGWGKNHIKPMWNAEEYIKKSIAIPKHLFEIVEVSDV